MRVEVLTVPDCPNGPVLVRRLAEALAGQPDVQVYQLVVTAEHEAARLGMHGSPTLLLDGRDPFAAADVPTSLSCRLYRHDDDRLGGAPSVQEPDDATIRAEIDVDQRFIGEDYAVTSPESTATIRELARAEGVFVGPVYTGKGLAGLLDHARAGRIPAGSNVAFLHTGDTGNLFEIPEVVGHISD